MHTPNVQGRCYIYADAWSAWRLVERLVKANLRTIGTTQTAVGWHDCRRRLAGVAVICRLMSSKQNPGLTVRYILWDS